MPLPAAVLDREFVKVGNLGTETIDLSLLAAWGIARSSQTQALVGAACEGDGVEDTS